MTLSQINQRLDLFKDYLAYRLDAKFTQLGFTYTPEYIVKMFVTHGFLINMRDIAVELLSFDQWLVLYNHVDLALSTEKINKGTTPLMQKVSYGGVNKPYEILGSFDFFKSMDEMLKREYPLTPNECYEK